MDVKLIYSTPQLHKLVEIIARVCYQSYGKLSPTSHSMVKAIMNKGHLSIASSGNIVFEVDASNNSGEDDIDIAMSLLDFKEINNFVRWTTPLSGKARSEVITISMNALTLRDLYEESLKEPEYRSELFKGVIEEVKKVPHLHWFIDKDVVVPPSDNPYYGNPGLGAPDILTEDYNALKELGLNDYELDVHATITIDMITDRASGLQLWRHGDMTGGCELSQRYCDRSNAAIREMIGINEVPKAITKYMEANDLSEEEATYHYHSVMATIDNHLEETLNLYQSLNDILKDLGVSNIRAKEIARSILPNAMTTRIIQCRPLRQWKHLLHLRDSNHAQPEVQSDAIAIKEAFHDLGIPTE